MKVQGITGWFDCRQYQKGIARGNRKMADFGSRINFSSAFTDENLPTELAEFSNKSEKNGLNYVTFKIFPKTCRMFTASNKEIDFPEYDRLDGGKFEVNVVIAIKHGTGTELNGAYVNALQIIRRADNPFDVVEGGDDSWVSGEVVPEEVNGKDPILDEDEGSMPF